MNLIRSIRRRVQAMKIARDDYNRQAEIEKRLESVEEQLSRLKAMRVEVLIKTRRLSP